MELLAPAGNLLSLKAAVASGADAVYLGLDRYGARMGACNFDTDALKDAVEFAHLHGVKIYLTVNTLIKDSEMADAVETVRKACEMDVDAFIVQDLGLISELRKKVPNAVLHASTQMGICNEGGAAYAKSLGITRVVVARETQIADIKKIKALGLEVELFCQGALCISYSGNCYYSSLVSGNSGNRGRCLQLCRKKYTLNGSKAYYLSAKDISLFHDKDLLDEIGVDSIKIEGRMRSPEYVARTVSVYRRLIDGNASEDDYDLLKEVFNRGDYCGSYLHDPTERVVHTKVQNHIGLKCGKVVNVKGRKAYLSLDRKLSIGDGVKYMRDGYEMGGGEIDGEISTGFRGDVKVGDDVNITSSISLKRRIEAIDPRIPAEIFVSISKAGGAYIDLGCSYGGVKIRSNVSVEKAQTHALSEKTVSDAIGILGDTPFTLDKLRMEIEEGVFFPASAVKDMRKSAVDTLKELILFNYERQSAPKKCDQLEVNWLEVGAKDVFVKVDTPDKLKKVRFKYDRVIYSPSDYSNYDSLRKAFKELGEGALLELPYIVRDKDEAVMRDIKELSVGIVANNISQLVRFNGKKVLGGIGLNHLNTYSYGTYINSIESDEIMNCGVTYAYGKSPLMQFAHCPRKTLGHNCSDCSGYDFRIKDDKGACYDLKRIKAGYCYSILVPTVPINIIKYARSGAMLIDLSYATDEEIAAVNEQILHKTPYTLPSTVGNLSGKLR